MMSASSELSLERRPFEGQLHKFTNLVKGWQYRWMILDPESGYLSYYASAEDKYDSGRPVRGSGHLAGAYIVPSQEDSTAFSVDFASGDTFKLRAGNVKERQMWVDKLRSVVESHDKALTAVSSASPPLREILPPTPPGSRSHLRVNGEPTDALQNLSLSVLDALGSVHDILHQCNVNHKELVRAVEKSSAPLHGDSLLLKSTSTSALLCLENALLMIQDIQESNNVSAAAAGSNGGGRLKSKTDSRFSLHSPLGSPRKKDAPPSLLLNESGRGSPVPSLGGGAGKVDSPTRSTTGSLKDSLKSAGS